MIATKAVELTGDFRDPVAVWHWFMTAMNRLPGLTILKTAVHPFPGGGVTGCVVIGESHAALHTWPERDWAWAELATCGDPATLDLFADAMAGHPFPIPGNEKTPDRIPVGDRPASIDLYA